MTIEQVEEQAASLAESLGKRDFAEVLTALDAGELGYTPKAYRARMLRHLLGS